MATWSIFCPVMFSTAPTRLFLPYSSYTALIFMDLSSTFTSESRGMEISELGPLFGLVSTRIVSVRVPGTSPEDSLIEPSRSSEPRISHDVACPLDISLSHADLLRLLLTQL